MSRSCLLVLPCPGRASVAGSAWPPSAVSAWMPRSCRSMSLGLSWSWAVQRRLRHAPDAPALPVHSCDSRFPRPLPRRPLHTAWLPCSCSSGDMAGQPCRSILLRAVPESLERFPRHAMLHHIEQATDFVLRVRAAPRRGASRQAARSAGKAATARGGPPEPGHPPRATGTPLRGRGCLWRRSRRPRWTRR